MSRPSGDGFDRPEPAARSTGTHTTVVTFSPTQLARACGFTSALSAVVALVLFLTTPWLIATCQGETMLTQTGVQVVSGGSTTHSLFDMDAEEVERGLSQEIGRNDDATLDRGWAMALFAVTLLGTLVMGLLFLRTLEYRHANAMAACAVAAAMILGAQLIAGFPLEHEFERAMRDVAGQSNAQSNDNFEGLDAMLANMIDVRRSGWLITTTVFSLISALTGLLALLATRSALMHEPPHAEAEFDDPAI